MAYTDINSEDRLVQATFAEHLEQQLGWESVYVPGTARPSVRTARWGAPIPACSSMCRSRAWEGGLLPMHGPPIRRAER